MTIKTRGFPDRARARRRPRSAGGEENEHEDDDEDDQDVKTLRLGVYRRRSVAWYHQTTESPQKNQMTAAIAR
jgi:hypothetical protein